MGYDVHHRPVSQYRDRQWPSDGFSEKQSLQALGIGY
ncbi:MAG: hypothetical protein QOD87_573, partial [Pseudonocardiales bacterium]|nr:hypothetical protein [Pseudonocardiales bacterium]